MPRIIALDYGLKRVGVAVTDPLKMFAQPLTTVAETEILAFLKNYLKQEEVETIVLGMPRNLDGSPTDGTAPATAFAEKLKQEFPDIPLELADERLTSRMAKASLLESGMKKQKRKDKKLLDTVSAALILQTYLETQR